MLRVLGYVIWRIADLLPIYSLPILAFRNDSSMKSGGRERQEDTMLGAQITQSCLRRNAYAYLFPICRAANGRRAVRSHRCANLAKNKMAFDLT